MEMRGGSGVMRASANGEDRSRGRRPSVNLSDEGSFGFTMNDDDGVFVL